jgi:tetratricopeptide (TPR) repeat protein
MQIQLNRVITILLLFSVIQANGQLEYLRLSPLQKIEQRIGATDVKLEFSRPQMKGREVFGGLVPYGKMWRTGANENTKISFSFRVKIDDVEVEAGTYALFTKPQKDNWEIYLYTDTNNLDVPNPIDSSKLIYLTTVKVELTKNMEETLTINFYDLTEVSAKLGIHWENVKVNVPIEFFTREAMEKAIAAEFEQNAFDYSTAAAYYYERGIELEKAKQLQERSIELREQPSSWSYNSYGLILYKLGEKEQAIEAIEYSLQLAKESKNDYLIKENQNLLSKWRE